MDHSIRSLYNSFLKYRTVYACQCGNNIQVIWRDEILHVANTYIVDEDEGIVVDYGMFVHSPNSRIGIGV